MSFRIAGVRSAGMVRPIVAKSKTCRISTRVPSRCSESHTPCPGSYSVSTAGSRRAASARNSAARFSCPAVACNSAARRIIQTLAALNDGTSLT